MQLSRSDPHVDGRHEVRSITANNSDVIACRWGRLWPNRPRARLFFKPLDESAQVSDIVETCNSRPAETIGIALGRLARGRCHNARLGYRRRCDYEDPGLSCLVSKPATYLFGPPIKASFREVDPTPPSRATDRPNVRSAPDRIRSDRLVRLQTPMTLSRLPAASSQSVQVAHHVPAPAASQTVGQLSSVCRGLCASKCCDGQVSHHRLESSECTGPTADAFIHWLSACM